MANQRNTKRNSITDTNFIAMYFEVDQNQAELARKLGLDRSSVYRRLKKIGKDRIEEARRSGTTSVIVTNCKQSAEQTQQLAYDNGADACQTSFNVITTLNKAMYRMNRLMEVFDKELDCYHSNPSNKVQMSHVGILCSMTREIRGMIEATHKIKKDLFNLEGLIEFQKMFIDIMETEIPDVRIRIYQKLEAIGEEEKYNALYPQ